MAEEKLWGACTPEEEERYRAIVEDRTENSPFYQLVGMEVTGLGCGWSTFKMETGPHLYNVGGIVHGGAIFSIADASCGVALATLLDMEHERPVTVEMKVNFCAPVMEGTITAWGQVVQRGTRIAVCESEVKQEERLVAKAMSTFMIQEWPVERRRTEDS